MERIFSNSDNVYKQLACPWCHISLKSEGTKLTCSNCKKNYPITDGIPNFCEKEEYWCNISKEKMQKLNIKARESGNWLESAKEIIPGYLSHIEPFKRADVQFMWPITKDARILDAGSMWGGVTIPVAQYCKEVFAVDKTIATLSFLKIRAEQMGFKNIFPMGTSLDKLPFEDNHFDLVVLSGVLEWVGFREEVVLETHWEGKRNKRGSYNKNPKEMQIEVLEELHRVIKPKGYLYLAIENRMGYQYLTGVPDDHVNIKFVSFLPRVLANIITKWKRGCEYRTYIYTKSGYEKLLKDTVFYKTKFWGVFPHYINPDKAIPFEIIKFFKDKIINEGGRRIKFFFKLFPKSIVKYFSPSILAIAQKTSQRLSRNPRIIDLLVKAGLLKSSETNNFEVIITDSRPGVYLTANYIIYDKEKKKPVYFCKICRNKNRTDVLSDEANNFKKVSELVQGSEIKNFIPRLLYYGTIEDITILVTNFMEGKKIKINKMNKASLRRLDYAVQLGIKLLVRFQKSTQIDEVEISSFLIPLIKEQRDTLKNNGLIDKEAASNIDNLKEEIGRWKGIKVPLCAVHGDYDSYNLLFKNEEAVVLDFEHFEPKGLPFFDLANLMFNAVLINIQNSKDNLNFYTAVKKYNLKYLFEKWLTLYSTLSGVDLRVLTFLGPIAALEQKTKKYPYYRDPSTYPMYQNNFFRDLMALRIKS
jgi:SAM-dependent methyltransferase/thiamine kinase-like enzyme